MRIPNDSLADVCFARQFSMQPPNKGKYSNPGLKFCCKPDVIWGKAVSNGHHGLEIPLRLHYFRSWSDFCCKVRRWSQVSFLYWVIFVGFQREWTYFQGWEHCRWLKHKMILKFNLNFTLLGICVCISLHLNNKVAWTVWGTWLSLLISWPSRTAAHTAGWLPWAQQPNF